VAKRARCTTGTVSYYFASKAEMMAALVEHLFDVFDTMLEGDGGQIDIKAIFERWFAWTQAADPGPWLAEIQLLAYAFRDPACAAAFRRRYGHYRSVLTGVIERGQAQAVIRSDIAADLLADQLCAIGDGWMLMSPIEPERFQPQRMQALLNATLAILSPPQQAARNAAAI
jgi:AcrR family transcriptional regulator